VIVYVEGSWARHRAEEQTIRGLSKELLWELNSTADPLYLKKQGYSEAGNVCFSSFRLDAVNASRRRKAKDPENYGQVDDHPT